MDTSGWANVISVAAFFVSVVAGVFSWKSSSEARIANKIGLHLYQRELLEGFLSSLRHLELKRKYIDRETIIVFESQARTAGLYVSKNLAALIGNYYDNCLSIISLEESFINYAETLRQAESEYKSIYAGEAAKLKVESAKSACNGVTQELDRMVESTRTLGQQTSEKIIDEAKIL